jgi:hypothetical protein
MKSKSTPRESYFPLDLQHKALFSGQIMQKRNNLKTTLTSVSTQLTYIRNGMEVLPIRQGGLLTGQD